MRRAAIILAGGKSQRFQKEGGAWRDKALIELDGKTMIEQVIEASIPVVDEVMIVTNTEERRLIYSKLLKNKHESIKLVIDERLDGSEGPLLGIYTGLKNTMADVCMILPCDVPFMTSFVIDSILSHAEEADVVVPTWPNGRIEPLLMSCKRQIGLSLAKSLLLLDRSRPDDLVRSSREAIFFSITSELRDPSGKYKAFINVNYPSDLEKTEVRVKEGSIKKTFLQKLNNVKRDEIDKFSSILQSLSEDSLKELRSIIESLEERRAEFWIAALSEKLGEIMNERGTIEKSARHYENEHQLYMSKSLYSLAYHALLDELRCYQRIKDSEKAEMIERKLSELRFILE